MSAVRKAGEPPASKPFVPVWRVTTAAPVRLLILSPSIWAYWTHFHNGRTLPCKSTHRETCDCELRESPLRWKGFLCAMTMESICGYVEVTPEQAKSVVNQAPSATSLRGLCYDFYRSSNAKGSRAKAFRVEHVQRDPDTLPQDRDPEKLLLRLWNSAKRRTM